MSGQPQERPDAASNGAQDPVVEEVRAARAALWEEAGRDLDALFELAARETDSARKQRSANGQTEA